MIRAVIAAAMGAALLTGAAPAEAGPAQAGAAQAGVVQAGVVRAAARVQAAARAKAKTHLTLSYTAEAGYATAVVLICNPPGGAHPEPVKACATLKKVAGQPSDLRPARTMCMMIYSPVTAQIAGTWQGKRINWSRKYGNSCEMNRANGVLFVF
jgi:Subtilisin inhibitor-like